MALHACVSPFPHASVLSFKLGGIIGGLVDHMSANHAQRIARELPLMNNTASGTGKTVNVSCWTLQSMLEALGRTRVDYWSLDTEGSEAEILRATDFSKVDVRVITVEVNDGQAESAVREAMKDKPYDLHSKIDFDLVYVKRGALQQDESL